MNYDNFEKYLKNREVYSNDLHVVLTKTPPRLFKFILLAVGIALMLFAGFAFFIKNRDFATADFILKVHPDNTTTITCVTDESTVSKISQSRAAILQVNSSKDRLAQKEVTIALNDLQFSPVYEINGHLYDSAEQIQEKLLSENNLIKKYKISIRLDSLSTQQYFGNGLQSQAGSLKFFLGEKRLIERFIRI